MRLAQTISIIKLTGLFLIAIVFHSAVKGQSPKYPFPQNEVKNYIYRDAISPEGLSRESMNDVVLRVYDRWRSDWLVDNVCEGMAYVRSHSKYTKAECVSEGMGYGMTIVVLMAGSNDSSQKIFDRMFGYVRNHPSVTDSDKFNKRKFNNRKSLIDSALMAWQQKRQCDTTKETSATDGDFDITYSLLLADAQWGSNGKVNYLHEAKKMLQDIRRRDIHPDWYYILLGNSIETGKDGSWDSCIFRPSDFMPTHFREFLKIDSTAFWEKVLTKNYKLIEQAQTQLSPGCFLFPDFLDCSNQSLAVPSQKIESRSTDSYFADNACRVPWRVAVDYILYGDSTAKRIAERFNDGIISLCHAQVKLVRAGYSLDCGRSWKGRQDPTSFSFFGPMAVAAMVDKKYAVWLDSLWKTLKQINIENYKVEYYDRSIQLLALLILTGNYWTPQIANMR